MWVAKLKFLNERKHCYEDNLKRRLIETKFISSRVINMVPGILHELLKKIQLKRTQLHKRAVPWTPF